MSESTSIRMMAERYASVKGYSLGLDWIEKLNIKQWSNEEKLCFMLCMPCNNMTWKMLDESYTDVKSEYWSRVRPDLSFVHSYDTEKAIDELLAHGRPKAAVQCFYYHHYDKKEIDIAKLVKALIAGIESHESELQREEYMLNEMIMLLQKDDSVSSNDLLKIEWGYLRNSSWHEESLSKTLEKHLQTDPVFFSEIAKMYCYVETSVILPNNLEKARTLMFRWSTPPGLHDNMKFVYSEFRDWLARVEELVADFEHLNIVLYEIGKVLFYTPADDDGFWVNKEVATLLNEKKYTDIRDGFFNEAYNSRGARIVDETGQADRSMAEMYRKRAELTEKEGLRLLAKSLEGIASSYDWDAKRTVERFSQRRV
jgi:hypothetical protein